MAARLARESRRTAHRRSRSPWAASARTRAGRPRAPPRGSPASPRARPRRSRGRGSSASLLGARPPRPRSCSLLGDRVVPPRSRTARRARRVSGPGSSSSAPVVGTGPRAPGRARRRGAARRRSRPRRRLVVGELVARSGRERLDRGEARLAISSASTSSSSGGWPPARGSNSASTSNISVGWSAIAWRSSVVWPAVGLSAAGLGSCFGRRAPRPRRALLPRGAPPRRRLGLGLLSGLGRLLQVGDVRARAARRAPPPLRPRLGASGVP